MADGKWIPFLRPEMPVGDAARHALFVRLQVVADVLPRALFENDEPEHIHQLRVATRRAAATMRIFRNCLPRKVRRRVRKRLRELRWAAGLVRDCDVFLADLQECRRAVPSEAQPGLDFLAGYVLAQRRAVQSELLTATHGFDFDFEPTVAAAVAGVRHSRRAALPLITLAEPLIVGLRDALQQSLAGNLDDGEQLHRVRIAGKQLRYAMEIFVDCFAPPFRDAFYPLVEELQETLGRINDSHVANVRLDTLIAPMRAHPLAEWQRLQHGVDELTRYHCERTLRERERFADWLTRWHATDTVEMLAIAAPVPPGAAPGNRGMADS